MPVSVYYVCALQKRFKIESAQKNLKNYRNSKTPEDSGSQMDKSGGGPQPPHHASVRLGLGRPQGWCRHLVHRLATPFGLYIASAVQTLKESTISSEEFRSSAGAISIDATAIFITVAASHDEEGVVLHRG